MTSLSHLKMTKNIILLVAALAVGLSGCASVRKSMSREAQERNPAPCPNILVLPEASRMVTFAGDEAIENIAWSGEITNVRSTCRYFGDEPIEATVEVDFAFGRGPMAGGNETQMQYFVAVTRTDTSAPSSAAFSVLVLLVAPLISSPSRSHW